MRHSPHVMSKTKSTEPKAKVLFPCCNFLAFGSRGAHRTESGIEKYAQCPKCGKRVRV